MWIYWYRGTRGDSVERLPLLRGHLVLMCTFERILKIWFGVRIRIGVRIKIKVIGDVLVKFHDRFLCVLVELYLWGHFF